MPKHSNKKNLIVIAGPTGVGKTALSVNLAKSLNAAVISADSRQVYRELTIGTAKPSLQEQQGIPHFFLGNKSIHDRYSVGNYEQEALECAAQLFKSYDTLLAVGGSGLYIKALCEGLDAFPNVPPEVRHQVEKDYHNLGLHTLQKQLDSCDPNYFREVDQNNPHRLIRAISVFRATGKPFSSYLNARTKKERPFQVTYLTLMLPRERLYERINERVDQMIEAGLVREASNLFPFRENAALQTVGYQELFDYFENKCSLEVAIEKIKQHSRNYAKRQVTWLKKYIPGPVFEPTQEKEILEWLEKVPV